MVNRHHRVIPHAVAVPLRHKLLDASAQLRVREGKAVRRDSIENQIGVRRAGHHPKIVDCQLRRNALHQLAHPFPLRADRVVPRLDRVEMWSFCKKSRSMLSMTSWLRSTSSSAAIST